MFESIIQGTLEVFSTKYVSFINPVIEHSAASKL